MMRAALAALLLLCAGQAAAQELGRLFFTPEQRAALDARRAARLPDTPAPVLAASPTTRIDGYVKRSRGKSTVWVDGAAVPEGTQPEGLRLRRGEDPTRVTVIVGEDGRRIDVRIGQTVDRASGAVKDVIAGGEIRVRRGER